MSNQVYIQDFNDSGNLKGFPEKFEIGNSEDGSVINMFTIKDKLYALKDLALYELQINKLENEAKDQETKVIQKLVIRRGPDSAFVAKTLLTAKSVFQHGNFKEKIREEIFGLCIDTLFEFSHLLEAVQNYNTLEEKEIESFNSSPKSKSNFVLPSISDIRTRAKTIFQKTDQITQNLI